MFEREHEAISNRPAPSSAADRAGHAGAKSISAQLMRLQRTAGNAGVNMLLQRNAETEEERSPVRDLMSSGGGSALDESTRGFMESRLGADFGDVRIHTGSKATEAARSVQAHAYTVGTDVVFQDGQYNPSSTDGKKMLAHELTHVVQQRQGPVDGTPAPGGISISDPSDRFESAAEATAEKVVGAGPGVQRQEAGEEEEEQLQATAIQRQESEEEDEELQASSIHRQGSG
ncbi:MAG TPA: DUF4157 domain-containing protein [Actinomycetota bacterium]|nr:DUF4157 domain-containing protein [Actinomycetota bacterium]